MGVFLPETSKAWRRFLEAWGLFVFSGAPEEWPSATICLSGQRGEVALVERPSAFVLAVTRGFCCACAAPSSSRWKRGVVVVSERKGRNSEAVDRRLNGSTIGSTASPCPGSFFLGAFLCLVGLVAVDDADICGDSDALAATRGRACTAAGGGPSSTGA